MSYTLSLKRIPNRYYNPYSRSSGEIILEYSFIQKALRQSEWDTLMTAFDAALERTNSTDFKPDIDGRYLGMEMKTRDRCEKRYAKGDFSKAQLRLIELLSEAF